MATEYCLMAVKLMVQDRSDILIVLVIEQMSGHSVFDKRLSYKLALWHSPRCYIQLFSAVGL